MPDLDFYELNLLHGFSSVEVVTNCAGSIAELDRLASGYEAKDSYANCAEMTHFNSLNKRLVRIVILIQRIFIFKK